MWKDLIFKLLIPVICVVSLVYNYDQHRSNTLLSKELTLSTSQVSKKDELLSEVVRPDGVTNYTFKNVNPPEFSRAFLIKKRDSLISNNFINSNKRDIPVAYTSTKFGSKLVDAKATMINDSIAAYQNSNWNISYNLSNTTFNAEYSTQQESYTYKRYPNSIGGLRLGKPIMLTDKWFNDSLAYITSSESITAPVVKDNHDFKVYISPEYSITNKSITTGVGADYRYKKIGIGGRYDFNALDKSNRPEHEFKINLKYYLINK